MNDVRKEETEKQKNLTNTTENRGTEGGKVMQRKKKTTKRKKRCACQKQRKGLKRPAVNKIRERKAFI